MSSTKSPPGSAAGSADASKAARPALSFLRFTGEPSIGFFSELASRKLHSYRLSTAAVPIHGYYSAGARKDSPALFHLRSFSFASDEGGSAGGADDGAAEAGGGGEGSAAVRPHAPAASSVAVPGVLLNMNTAEQFKKADKMSLLRKAAKQLCDDIDSGEALHRPQLLGRFVLLSFSELKSHRFVFWFAFPTFKQARAVEHSVTALSDALSPAALAQLHEAMDASAVQSCPVWVVLPGSDAEGDDKQPLALKPLAAWETELSAEQRSRAHFLFVDACSHGSAVSWPLRNLILLLSRRFALTSARVIAYRRPPGTDAALDGSLFLQLKLPELTAAAVATGGTAALTAVGWAVNATGRAGPTVRDFQLAMDAKRLATTSAELNLSLMKWRALPSLDTDLLAGTHALLLGAGTLGCVVARNLLAWGVRRMTLLDSGHVSYSNPVRQSLYAFEDSAAAAPKAEAAAAALKRIHPTVDARGVQVSIPMPGHAVSERDAAIVVAAAQTVEQLIKEADVVFLLTDTRESRWLPTMLAAAHGKLLINVALGFDSYLVQRHGVAPAASSSDAGEEKAEEEKAEEKEEEEEEDGKADDEEEGEDKKAGRPLRVGTPHLGCYFCNDVVAPQDSTRDRTLDQQCTVTRPGLANIAGSLAVELMVGLLHHPLAASAAADGEMPLSDSPALRLGLLPHCIRGYLTHFSNVLITSPPFAMCTACSPAVRAEYVARGADFLLSAFNSPAYLETLTGLAALKAEADDVMLEWDEEGEDGDDW